MSSITTASSSSSSTALKQQFVIIQDETGLRQAIAATPEKIANMRISDIVKAYGKVRQRVVKLSYKGRELAGNELFTSLEMQPGDVLNTVKTKPVFEFLSSTSLFSTVSSSSSTFSSTIGSLTTSSSSSSHRNTIDDDDDDVDIDLTIASSSSHCNTSSLHFNASDDDDDDDEGEYEDPSYTSTTSVTSSTSRRVSSRLQNKAASTAVPKPKTSKEILGRIFGAKHVYMDKFGLCHAMLPNKDELQKEIARTFDSPIDRTGVQAVRAIGEKELIFCGGGASPIILSRDYARITANLEHDKPNVNVKHHHPFRSYHSIILTKLTQLVTDQDWYQYDDEIYMLIPPTSVLHCFNAYKLHNDPSLQIRIQNAEYNENWIVNNTEQPPFTDAARSRIEVRTISNVAEGAEFLVEYGKCFCIEQ